MARFGTVDYLVAEHVARVTMDRAVKRNALDDELIDGLDAAFAEAERDPDVHVVVLAASVDEIAAEIATIPTHAELLNRDTPFGPLVQPASA